MIKKFPEYVLPEIFEFELSNWHLMNPVDIIDDLRVLLRKNDLEYDIILSGDYQFHEEEDVLDIEFFLDEPYENFYGNLYVTWKKENDWPCTHIWFDGFDESDINHFHKYWDNE